MAITNSPLSPLAKHARVLFTIPEDEYSFSRLLAGPMCLVQCLAVAMAALLQPDRGATPRIPTVTGIERDRSRASRQAKRAGDTGLTPPRPRQRFSQLVLQYSKYCKKNCES